MYIKNIDMKELITLPKLKIFMMSLNMTINKSKLIREININRRTVDKYLNSYQPGKTRNKRSKIDEYYDKIKLLLLEESLQKFYNNRVRVLWQYLKDNHGLD